MKNKSAGIRCIAAIVAILTLVMLPLTEVNAATSTVLASLGSYTAALTHDPTTYNISETAPGIGHFGASSDDGKVWTDKSVSTSALLGSGVEMLIPAPKKGNFNIMLSALAQQYITTTTSVSYNTAADVVLILDVTGSMESNKISTAGVTGSMTRTQAMVNAANDAIKVIMDANPGNRVAVTTFTTSNSLGTEKKGWSNNSSVLLPLGSYPGIANGKYLVYNSATVKTADGVISPSVSVDVDGGTNSQEGIQYGIDLLVKNIAAESAATGGERQPFVLLLTDGAAAGVSTKWYGTQQDLALPADRLAYGNDGTEQYTALTILTAMYQKNRLDAAYTKYNTGKTVTKFFNIGLGIDSLDDTIAKNGLAKALLKPSWVANYATNGNAYATSVHDQIVNSVAAAPPEYASYANDFTYADAYCYFAKTTDELKSAFDTLAIEVATATKAVASPVLAVGGYAVKFTDVLGHGIEIKSDPLLQITGVNYLPEAPVKTQSGGQDVLTYSYKDFKGLTAVVRTAAGGEQTVEWDIPNNLLPLFEFKDINNPSLLYNSALPIRIVYQVGLSQKALDAEKLMSDVYYANLFTGSAAAAVSSSKAVFTPTKDNPYYYITDPSSGSVVMNISDISRAKLEAHKTYFVGTAVTNAQVGQTLNGVYVTRKMADSAALNYDSGDVGSLKDAVLITADMVDSISGCVQKSSAAVVAGENVAFASGYSSYKSVTQQKLSNDTGSEPNYYTGTFNLGDMSVRLGNNGKITLSASDLIFKEVDKAAVEQGLGTQIAYRITVTNNTGATITAASVSDIMDAGLTFVSATGGGNYDGVSRKVTWTIPTLEVGKSMVFTVNAIVDSTLPDDAIIRNKAILTANGNDTTSREVTTVVVGNPPGVTKTVDKTTAFCGERLTYSIYLENASLSEMKNLVVRDVVPAGLVNIAVNDGGSNSSGTLEWTIPSIAPYGVAKVTFTADVPANLSVNSTFSNTAQLISANGDTKYARVSNTVSTSARVVQKLTVTKSWGGDEFAATQRPESAVVKLKAVSSSGDVTAQLTGISTQVNIHSSAGTQAGAEGYNGKYTWDNLPIYDVNRNVISYTLEETAPNYTTSYSGSATSAAVPITFISGIADVRILNTYNGATEKVSLTANKIWSGFAPTLPESISVKLSAKSNGVDITSNLPPEIASTVKIFRKSGTPTSDNGFGNTFIWNNLPKNYKGSPIIYSIEETPLNPDFSVSYSGSAAATGEISFNTNTATGVITNKYTGAAGGELGVNVIWAGDVNSAPPTGVSMSLTATAGGADITKLLPNNVHTNVLVNVAAGTQANDIGFGNAYKWEKLPGYYGEQPISYRIEQKTPAGYMVAYGGAAGPGGEITFGPSPTVDFTANATVTNTFVAAGAFYSRLGVTKVWSGFSPSLPDAVTIKLKASTASGNDVTATLMTGMDFVVTLKREGGIQAGAVGYNNTYAWSNLPKFHKGENVTYAIEELPQAGFSTTYSGDIDTNSGIIKFGAGDTASATVTNTYSGADAGLSLTINKLWGGYTSVLPGSVTVGLSAIANNTDITASLPKSISTAVVINGAKGTQTADVGYGDTYVWPRLPMYFNGSLISYKISETPIADYVTSYSGSADTSGTISFVGGSAAANITNTYSSTVEYYTSLTVTKQWSGFSPTLPSFVNVVLTASAGGADVTSMLPTTVKTAVNIHGENKVPTPDDGYNGTYTWSNLPKHYAGKPIVYAISENPLPAGFTAAYSDAANANGEITFDTAAKASAKITNTYTGAPTGRIIKLDIIWVGTDANRPAGVSVTLEAQLAKKAAAGGRMMAPPDRAAQAPNPSTLPNPPNPPNPPPGANVKIPMPSNIHTDIYINRAAGGAQDKAVGFDNTYTWAILPRYYNGEEISYSITQAPAGKRYSIAYGGAANSTGAIDFGTSDSVRATVTNTYSPVALGTITINNTSTSSQTFKHFVSFKYVLEPFQCHIDGVAVPVAQGSNFVLDIVGSGTIRVTNVPVDTRFRVEQADVGKALITKGTRSEEGLLKDYGGNAVVNFASGPKASPKTGDNSQLWMWACLASISAVASIMFIRGYRHTKCKRHYK
ncbi:MAG: Cna B-type domain-containing protein [Oscillospiraceae bacterium]